MKKKKYRWITIILLVLLVASIYFYVNSIRISGVSDNGMWKVVYKKSLDEAEQGEWYGSIKQLNKQEVKVKGIKWLENGKTIADFTEFNEGRDEAGAETRLNPFYVEDLYGSNPPKKGYTYMISVIWEKDGKMHEDNFEIN